MIATPKWLQERLFNCHHLALFLDYDGTLAGFVPTPDLVIPSQQVIGLVDRLARDPRIDVTILSGRRLDQLRSLVPLKGVTLAGVYGVEMQLPSGQILRRANYNAVRPGLEEIRSVWIKMIAVDQGFYLEDKGWALAIHARAVSDPLATEVLLQLRQAAESLIDKAVFRIVGGNKFLEVGLQIANKGKTVDYLLERRDWPRVFPLYLGDDDKDAEAFAVVRQYGGAAVLVGDAIPIEQADWQLASPAQALEWLADLPENLDK